MEISNQAQAELNVQAEATLRSFKKTDDAFLRGPPNLMNMDQDYKIQCYSTNLVFPRIVCVGDFFKSKPVRNLCGSLHAEIFEYDAIGQDSTKIWQMAPELRFGPVLKVVAHEVNLSPTLSVFVPSACWQGDCAKTVSPS